MPGIDDGRVRYRTKDSDQQEKLSWSYWDRQTIVSGTTTVLNFYQAVPANKLLGNIPLAGQLPADQSFQVHNIRFVPVGDSLVFTSEALNADPATEGDALNDVEQIVMNGFLTFRIQNKDYGEWPLVMLPSGCGVWGFSTLAGTAVAPNFGALTLAGNGPPDARSVFALSPPQMIHPQSNFIVRCEWPTAPTLRGGNAAVMVVLDGILYRPTQ